MTANGHPGFRKTLTGVAAATLVGPVFADEEEVRQLTRPDTATVSVGGAWVSGDSRERSLFGQYNGLREQDGYLLLDLDYVTRNDATGLWTIFHGRDLGLSTRELEFTQERQGDWKYNLGYSELTRWYPRTINTGLQGAGTTNTVVNLLSAPGTGRDIDLKTDRKALDLGGTKWINPNLSFEAVFRNEDKEGARLFGKGFNCSSGAAPPPTCTPLPSGSQWALLMLPEPIDSSTRQIDAKLTWSDAHLAVTAGYYGSFYVNNNGVLNVSVPGNLNNPLGNPMGQDGSQPLTPGLRGILELPMALPPDNQAHQFYATGNYAFTPTTQSTFKLAYTHATQNDDFASNGLTDAPAGRTNYGGVLDTWLAQLGLTSRPVPRLSLRADVRFEDKKDKSPLALYNIEGTNPFTNSRYPLRTTKTRFEETYRFAEGLSETVGFTYEQLDRGNQSQPECVDLGDGNCIGTSVGGITAVRERTGETGYYAELRKSLSETLTGWIRYSGSNRGGSSWLVPNELPATGTTPVSDEDVYKRTGIFPMTMMNRQRDSVKAQADWSPMDALSLQFTAQGSHDRYSAPTQKGLSSVRTQLYGIDATYVLSDAWKMSAYYTYSQQTQDVAHSTGYQARLGDRNNAAGLNLTGNPSPKWQVGADLLYVDDLNSYEQSLDAEASSGNVAFFDQSGGLPDVPFKDFRVSLFATYALQKNSAIRIDLVHDHQQLNEWTWSNGAVPFQYSDGTTVNMNPNQQVTYIGIRYIYRWR